MVSSSKGTEFCTWKLWAWRLLFAKFTEEFALELETLMELNLLKAFERKVCDEELGNCRVCGRFLWGMQTARPLCAPKIIEVPCNGAAMDVAVSLGCLPNFFRRWTDWFGLWFPCIRIKRYQAHVMRAGWVLWIFFQMTMWRTYCMNLSTWLLLHVFWICTSVVWQRWTEDIKPATQK
jgi:hypothetical protein